MKKLLCVLIAASFIVTVHVNAYATSLWQGETIQTGSFFVDQNMPSIAENDIVTILVEEKANATMDADTEIEVEDTIEGKITNWFTVENFSDISKLFNFESPEIKTKKNNTDNLPEWGLEINNEFEGEGETIRTNTITATIAARVVSVKPNGNVILEGKRNITINHEMTMITVTGTARAKDITKDNTIKSSLIADMQLSIDGEGIISNGNKKGIFSTLISLLR